MQLSWQNSHDPNHNHNHYRMVLRQQSKHLLLRSIDWNQEAVPSAVVEVLVKGEEKGIRDGYSLMERMASGTLDGGTTITTVGHVGLISNTTG